MSAAARVTDPIVSPATGGVPMPILGPGEPTVLIGGLPAARVGDTCGPDVVAVGASSVLIGGVPAARVGSATAAGGAVMPPGEPTVLIGG